METPHGKEALNSPPPARLFREDLPVDVRGPPHLYRPKAGAAHSHLGGGQGRLGHVFGADGKPQRFGDVWPIPILETMVGRPHAQCRHHGRRTLQDGCRSAAGSHS